MMPQVTAHAASGTDRPILFSAPMVRALLDGRKAQTRRVLKLPKWASADPSHIEFGQSGAPEVICRNTGCLAALPLPYAAGDRLWVKETWRTSVSRDSVRAGVMETPGNGYGWPVWYEADGGVVTWRGSKCGGPGFEGCGKLRPSLFMARWASRLTLTVTDVRVERLNDISEADAIAEGIEPSKEFADRFLTPAGDYAVPVIAFQRLWESIHGADAWAVNPFVVAVTFSVRRANIDAPPAPAAAPRSEMMEPA